MDAHPAGSLLSFLAAVPDPRSRRSRRHPLSAIRALSCWALMCGAKSYAASAQWGKDQDIGMMHRLGFTRKPPKIGGIRKVLIALNLKTFEGKTSPTWRKSRMPRRPLGRSTSIPSRRSSSVPPPGPPALFRSVVVHRGPRIVHEPSLSPPPTGACSTDRAREFAAAIPGPTSAIAATLCLPESCLSDYRRFHAAIFLRGPSRCPIRRRGMPSAFHGRFTRSSGPPGDQSPPRPHAQPGQGRESGHHRRRRLGDGLRLHHEFAEQCVAPQ
jgi:hypothetical protein